MGGTFIHSESMLQNIVLLGATGSIGHSTLSVVREHSHRFRIAGLAARARVEEFCALAAEFPDAKLCLFEEAAARDAAARLGRKVGWGMEGLLELIHTPEATTVVNGLMGSIGCLPTMEAIRLGLRVCLANKETLVMAGGLINELLDRHPKASLQPVDSEHSAVHQCLAGRPAGEVEALILTASGGPFRTLPAEKFQDITLAQALKHPTWTMGPKITVDSATLFNKGLEVIEAHVLFRIPFDRIEVLVHPGSHVHSLVRFVDGAVMAQLGTPDMRLPILYALTAPERIPLSGDRLDLARIGTLHFEEPDLKRFPSLALAYAAGRKGGIATAVLNAANEVAVGAFLQERIAFLDIPALVERTLGDAPTVPHPDLDALLEADAWARRHVQTLVETA